MAVLVLMEQEMNNPTPAIIALIVVGIVAITAVFLYPKPTKIEREINALAQKCPAATIAQIQANNLQCPK